MCDVLRRYLYILQTTVTKYHCCVNLLVHKYKIVYNVLTLQVLSMRFVWVTCGKINLSPKVEKRTE